MRKQCLIRLIQRSGPVLRDQPVPRKLLPITPLLRRKKKGWRETNNSKRKNASKLENVIYFFLLKLMTTGMCVLMVNLTKSIHNILGVKEHLPFHSLIRLQFHNEHHGWKFLCVYLCLWGEVYSRIFNHVQHLAFM